jgi:hypothetical protein
LPEQGEVAALRRMVNEILPKPRFGDVALLHRIGSSIVIASAAKQSRDCRALGFWIASLHSQ